MIDCVYPAFGQAPLTTTLCSSYAGQVGISVGSLHVHPPTQTPLQASCFARTFVLREKP